MTKWIFENYDIPYLIGTTGEDNLSSYRLLERCGYKFIDKRTLLVHIEGKCYNFYYYKCYRT